MSATPIACIFCGNRDQARGVAHIVPESLGGPQSPVAPAEITCDRCNQYFGRKLEAVALRSFPFSEFRLLASIPTKKGRYIAVPSMIGTLSPVGPPRLLELRQCSDAVAAGILSGEVSQVPLLAEVTEPLAVWRLLLKIGLEMLAKHFYDVATSDRAADTRAFARQPSRGSRWWCILHSKPSALMANQDEADWSVEIIECSQSLTSVLRLPGVRCLVTLESEVLPPEPGTLEEPEYRIVWGVC